MPSTPSGTDRRKTLRQVAVGLAIIGVVAVFATIRESTIRQETDDAPVDKGSLRICVSPGPNRIEGDIPPGNMTHLSIHGGKVTDVEEKYATFLEHALPRLQGRDANIEPDFYVHFSVFFEDNEPSGIQFAQADICKKKFGAAENACRRRTYISYAYYEPEVLAEVLVDDILKAEPRIKRCRWAN